MDDVSSTVTSRRIASRRVRIQPGVDVVRFGIYVLPNKPWSELERRWRLVEDLGFDSVWGCDDLYWPEARGGICFDGLVILAAMAARTSRIRVGTLMLSLPIRDNPAVLAKEIIALDHLSKGRLEFGFGAGILEGDHTGAGHEFWAKDERIARFREAVEIVDRALREQVVTYSGRYYRTTELWTSPGPLQRPRPPIVIAAHSAGMLRIAAKYADTWNSYGGFLASEEEIYRRTADRSRRLDDLCVEIGRDPSSVGRSFLVFESSGNLAGAPPIRAFSSAEAFRDLAGRYAEIGVSELILYFPDAPEHRRVMEEIVALLPDLR
jgi:alkanesulfonate monooxygenase SsuD/methylene tetrahydromethanopterin reductase-like flavin-dependent oxidoreductase (luciferase family)